MKDTDKVELTVGNVKEAAESCGTAKEVLKKLFPEVFIESPPEWEDVTGKAKLYEWVPRDGKAVGVWFDWDCPFLVCTNNGSGAGDRYKIEDSKIWRRKS